jgi:DNA-binding Xre family transcriptional regulator
MTWSVENYKGQENNRLIVLMTNKGFTLQTLAKESGISEKTLWSMIKGRSFPRLDTILLICKSLNCTMDELYPIDYTKHVITTLTIYPYC